MIRPSQPQHQRYEPWGSFRQQGGREGDRKRRPTAAQGATPRARSTQAASASRQAGPWPTRTQPAAGGARPAGRAPLTPSNHGTAAPIGLQLSALHPPASPGSRPALPSKAPLALSHWQTMACGRRRYPAPVPGAACPSDRRCRSTALASLPSTLDHPCPMRACAHWRFLDCYIRPQRGEVCLRDATA